MLKALNRLFGGRSGVIETAPSARVLPFKDAEDEGIPRYPPFAKGLPVASLDKIMATQAELIEKVRNSLGFTVDDFNRLVLPVIQRYAAFVHLLPASESHHHRGAGGLFRHGLEVAFWAAQVSESVIFSIEGTPRERRDNEPRWRLASCFSGLLHDVGKPLSDVSITDKDGAITWNPYSESLHDWAHCHEIDRYFIRWRDKRHKRHEQFSLLAVDRIIPAETREFLSKSGPSIMEAMLEAIAGTSVNQPVTKLMLRADQESVSRDLRQSRLDVDEFSYGVPVERYVFDTIRRLVKTGKWQVNEPGAKVWHLNQGVFIAWKQLGDLYDLISHDKIPGIPRDPDTLADILIERGFAVPNTVQEKGERAYYRYWEVLPEMLQEAADSVKILMLRLESNDLVFTTEPPAAVAAQVIGDVEDAEIEFVDLEEADDDQEKAATALNDDILAAARKPEPKEDLSPQDVAKNTPATANDNPLQAPKVVEGRLGGIDVSPDAYSASAETTSTDAPEQRASDPELAHKHQANQHEKDAKTLLVEMLAGYGEASVLLEQAIMPVLAGKTTLGEALCLMQGQAVILCPDGARSLGASSEVLSKLSQANAIVPDPIMPGRKVRNFRGVKGIVLAEQLSDAVVAAIRDTEAAMDGYQNASALDTPPGSDPSNNKRAPKQRRRKKPQQQKPGVDAGKAAPGQKPHQKKADGAVAGEDQNRKPNQETQNVARLPKRETQPDVPKPLSQREQQLGRAEVPENPVQEISALEPPKATTNPQDTKDEDFFPSRVTPQQALQMLKGMIQKRSGRWLVTPVVEEDGYLVTSDKAFDMIAGGNIGISKHILCGMLSRAQRRPLLKKRQGKLYLEVDET